MNTIVDYSQKPVYTHEIYNRETGEFLYFRQSYSSQPDQEYLDLQDWASQKRRERSEWIRAAKPGKEMSERLETPDPEEFDWMFSIQELFPQNPYATNDGGRRKKALQKRLDTQAPLFAEELYDRALEEEEDYFSGNAECDQIKAAARETYTDEYWDARFWADLEERRYINA